MENDIGIAGFVVQSSNICPVTSSHVNGCGHPNEALTQNANKHSGP
jgi:hypothetical protein